MKTKPKLFRFAYRQTEYRSGVVEAMDTKQAKAMVLDGEADDHFDDSDGRTIIYIERVKPKEHSSGSFRLKRRKK